MARLLTGTFVLHSLSEQFQRTCKTRLKGGGWVREGERRRRDRGEGMNGSRKGGKDKGVPRGLL